MRPARFLSVCIVALALSALSGGVACTDNTEEHDGKRVAGTEGRERWVVTFEGAEPDLADYRQLLKDKPDDAELYADKMRKKLSSAHADFESALESLGARVVERWWMSNAMTVEIDAAKAPSLEKQPGVKSAVPDVPLAP